jgi:ATP-binding cassette subfamily F protein 3
MLRFQLLSKSFGTKVLFENVTLDLPAGEKIALVGANGCGKTTLLNIITHLESADGGEVIVPAKAELSYLPQQPNAEPEATALLECVAGSKKLFAQKKRLEELVKILEAGDHSPQRLAEHDQVEAEFSQLGGYALESRASEILVGLGFSAAQLQQNPLELSGGWRMRLELGKIFLNNPDVLILDEPTNHLDLPSLAWTEQFLRSFKGTLIFVSHDRVLLNRLSTYTVHLANEKLALYAGNFDSFMEQRQRELEHNQAMLARLAAQRKQYERFVERFGAKATKASQARSRVKMIERIKLLEKNFEPDDEAATMGFNFAKAEPSGRTVVEMQDLAIGYDRPLVTGLNLKIERGQRIAIIGANGIGKSTLIKTLAGRIPDLGGQFQLGHQVKMSYFAQDPMELFDTGRDILSHLLDADPALGERAARSLLGGFLFRSEDVFKKPQVLSGGEKNRLAMAILLARRANLLLLDEPTNHLDMHSVEVLIEALEQYEGTVMFVSHNRDFIDALCTHVLVMLADGRHALFHGQLSDYERLSAVSGFPNVLATAAEPPPASTSAPTGMDRPSESKSGDHQLARQLKTDRARLKKQIDQWEQTAEENRRRIAQLTRQFSEIAPSDYQKLNQLQTEIAAAEHGVDEADGQWLAASEQLEQIDAKLAAMGRQG